MSVYILFEVWGVAVALALAAILVILKPMFTVLVEVCGGADRARFWAAYACVFTVVTPLMAVSTPGLLDSAAAQGSGRAGVAQVMPGQALDAGFFAELLEHFGDVVAHA